MFGWARNSIMTVVFEIEIAVVYPNTNLLFRNSEITAILLFRDGDGITIVLLNSSLLFQINNPNNISTIRNNITILLSPR
jgi:hypothetical protein